MTPAITIVYPTFRADPRFEWFADSLARQADDGVDVVIVDGAYSPERGARFAAIVAGRFALRHVAAKPTPYAGPFRRTRRDFFAAASARNTGIVHATAPYVVFADDLSVLMPGWWKEVQAAAHAGIVVAGAFQKHRAMVVDQGRLLSSRCKAGDVDSRWAQGQDGATTALAGSQLYGCSFGAPRDLLVEVNGFDELCDSIGGEDWHLGVRLEWAGATLRYSRRMLTVESEELHHVGTPALRVSPTVPPTVYHRRLREFGVTARHVAGKWDSGHMIVDLVFGVGSTQTLGNHYLLDGLDPDGLDRTHRRLPDVHWFDRRPLAQL